MWLYYQELIYMQFPTSRKKYFSEEVGGGGRGVANGIVQDTMITGGLIIVMPRLGTEEFPMIGEIIIETIFGVVILGIRLTFIMVILIGIGVVVNGALIMGGNGLADVNQGAEATGDAPVPIGK
jgi:hypothetical protein